jgi:hypothetical protein
MLCGKAWSELSQLKQFRVIHRKKITTGLIELAAVMATEKVSKKAA